MFFERDLGIVTCATNDQGKPVIKFTFASCSSTGASVPAAARSRSTAAGGGVGARLRPTVGAREGLRNYMRNVKMHRG